MPIHELEDTLLDAFDAIVDGGVAKRFPESIGASFRIEVDSPSGLPHELSELIQRIEEFIHDSTNEYGRGLGESKYVDRLRIVSGHALGKF